MIGKHLKNIKCNNPHLKYQNMIVRHGDIKSLICNFQYGISWRNKVFAKHMLVFRLLPATD